MPDSDYASDGNGNQKEERGTSNKGMGKLWDQYVKGRSAGWTAIFTGVLTVATSLLAYIAYQTNETNRTSQRAFVSFPGTGGTAGNKITDPEGKTVTGIQFIVVWANGGNTPTRTATTHINWQSWSPEIPKTFEFPDLPVFETRPIVVGPHSGTPVTMVVPIGAFKDAKERRQRLYIWGWSEYRDVFSGTPLRLTEFCSELINIGSTRPDITDVLGEVTWQTTTCYIHNCYDEDCPDYRKRTKQ